VVVEVAVVGVAVAAPEVVVVVGLALAAPEVGVALVVELAPHQSSP
jgi:hypothetical protein